MQVELPSLQSLYLEMYYDNQKLSSGTGFVVQKENQSYFVTNRHNFTGRDNITDKCLSASAAIPNKVAIFHNKVGISDCEIGTIGKRIKKIENLYAGEKKLWFEHPILGKEVDVVALKLTQAEDVYFYPYSIERNRHYENDVKVSQRVSIIGFPFGEYVGDKLTIWSTGYLATEPNYDYNAKPTFLVDCRTRQGQSGSPVIRYQSGGGVITTSNSNVSLSTGYCNFLGIYSGRINKDSDLGIVWKKSVIRELIDSIV